MSEESGAKERIRQKIKLRTEIGQLENSIQTFQVIDNAIR
jgi:hypothetical protein